MNAEIALFLIQDGLTNGAIYALLALALVLVFAVTRVIFIPQGEFVAYGALTLASLQLGKLPGTSWLLLGAGLAVALVELVESMRQGASQRIPGVVFNYIVVPSGLVWLTWWAAPQKPALTFQVLLTLATVVPLGPMVYRLAYQPLANASVLVL
ncbi:MAG: branched-chain amino acid ABC transporter permease, partial [Proteobacteria bacterium]|nr:branched-chain amino acid ABC transporter permease [Pseudomonadota bacterium]